MSGPQIAFLPDGRRLHLQHGPIDLIIDAEGPGRAAALRAAATRFETVLEELVAELSLLRAPVGPRPGGEIARVMQAATHPFAAEVITPMAAVAGAVAEAVLAAMTGAGALTRAYVNNGGDIALHLAPGQSFAAAIVSDRSGAVPARARIPAASPVRGIATSGRHGRSHSLGIADSVTVLAATAAAADAAATMIANAVDLPGNPKVRRCPARALAPDSDLGDRLVTTGLDPLTPAEVARALARGRGFAAYCLERGLIHAALLHLAGQSLTLGAADLISSKDPCHA
ncbi:UPF0280 family protein [Pseudodonghicola flavimaris]|uniref:UPF0280 family protein n=1 Tax=Pseudodonghicola flavimaris TaxID=3050036 RepID=A0ABT7F294_9RHOB|nr:UPF0280 family protein [Pseudodonghicola flavimaris]MDK3018729.1 UPF0280 family protein [Pseudodonghicola flavimaris]